MSASSAIDWAHLRAEAVAASRRAYVPYSRFPVGAAALTTSGRVITGCNVENAAYGVVLCAECGLVSSLLATGAEETAGPVVDVAQPRERLVALVCVDGEAMPITPCGRCRQLLHEHALAPTSDDAGLLVDLGRTGGGPKGIAFPVAFTDLLPHAFGVTNLDALPSSAAYLKGES